MSKRRGTSPFTLELNASIRAKLAAVAGYYGASWEDAIYLAVHHEWNGIQLHLAECEAARAAPPAPQGDDDVPW